MSNCHQLNHPPFMSEPDTTARSRDDVSSPKGPVRRYLRSRAWWIAGFYALFATLWIYFSDTALAALFPDPELMIQVSMYKGLGFVAITTGMLLLMMRGAFGALEDGYQALKEHEIEIGRLKSLYAALSQISQAIVWTPDRDELLRKVCRVLVEHGGFHMAWIGWHSPETRQILPVAEWGDASGYLKNIEVYSDERPEGRGPTGTAFREDRPYICNDLRRDPATLPWREEARRRNLRASAVFPIRMKGEVCGTLSVYSDEVNFFQDKETALLAEAAVDISFALDNFAREEARSQAEEKMRQSNERFQLLARATNDAVWDWQFRTHLVWWNEGYETLFGYPAEETDPGIVKSWNDRIHPEDAERVVSSIHAVINDSARHEWSAEYRFRRRDGSYASIFDRGFVIRDAAGRAIRMIGAMQDFTARKQAEMSLRELNETLENKVGERTRELALALQRAEAADQVKSAFLATMSHELRTPLNSIIGFTGIVLQGLAGPLNAEQTKQLGMVRSSARHLLELINDVLDLSKIEAGQLEVRAGPFDLRESIAHVVASVKPMAEKKGIELTTSLTQEVGMMVNDRRRVEQILLNLLNNAIKFTESGSVSLKAEILPVSQSVPCLSVSVCVADTGIGIKPEDLDMLFQPFRQIDAGLTRQHEGTGLGLAICRRLAALMGGRISASSVWSCGSEFTVILPLQHPASP